MLRPMLRMPFRAWHPRCLATSLSNSIIARLDRNNLSTLFDTLQTAILFLS